MQEEDALPPRELVATVIDCRGRSVSLTRSTCEHIELGHPEIRERDVSRALAHAKIRTRGKGVVEKLWARDLGPARWLVVVVAYSGPLLVHWLAPSGGWR